MQGFNEAGMCSEGASETNMKSYHYAYTDYRNITDFCSMFSGSPNNKNTCLEFRNNAVRMTKVRTLSSIKRMSKVFSVSYKSRINNSISYIYRVTPTGISHTPTTRQRSIPDIAHKFRKHINMLTTQQQNYREGLINRWYDQ